MRYILHLCNVGLMCVIWLFDDDWGEQVILSYKGNRESSKLLTMKKCLVYRKILID